MQGGGGEGVLPVLRTPDNATNTAPPEQIRVKEKDERLSVMGIHP